MRLLSVDDLLDRDRPDRPFSITALRIMLESDCGGDCEAAVLFLLRGCFARRQPRNLLHRLLRHMIGCYSRNLRKVSIRILSVR